MNERLKQQLRVVFAFWLVGVLTLAFLTLRGTDSSGVSPLDLLLRRPEPTAPQLLAAPVELIPVPVAEPESAPVPVEDPEMPRGKKAGAGTLHKAVVESLANGSVTVTFALEGTSGQYAAFSQSGFSRSVDLHGRWQTPRLREYPKSRAIRLIQVENHNGFVRVSATRTDGALPLVERVTLPSGAIRIRFSEGK